MSNENIATQVIGCAYSYQVSLSVRRAKTIDSHSSHTREFSFFKKVENIADVVREEGTLRLRKHPVTNQSVNHWYEPELAVVLGEQHRIVGYLLANDFTAIDVESESIGKQDATYVGKVWAGSCSISSRIVTPAEIDADNLKIGLRIERNREAWERTYTTQQRKWPFEALAKKIVEYYEQLKQEGELRQSKQIIVENGFLPAGTIILTGTGLITPSYWYAQRGDIVSVYCKEIGELRNKVK
jgi:2-keto-4-pentenoate hydratase/2-oxohepta-3-ene-1,7-dioic acid hydratase in catechol pathway